MPQELSALCKEPMIVGPLIIGIGPRPRLPCAAREIERVFRVNPATQIDTMIAVLGGSQNQLRLCEITRVKIQRPCLRMPSERLILGLPLIRRLLPLHDSDRIDQRLKRKKGLLQ